MRTLQGNYLQAFVVAGATGIVAAGLSLLIRGAQRSPVPAQAA
jgi:hypothetical protein